MIGPLARLVESRADAAAFVIACYSDPGLETCREIARRPVYGIQEAGVLTALGRADRIGIVGLSPAAELRHRRYMRRMGVSARIVGERTLDMGVDESARGEGTFARLEAVGRALAGDGAEAIVLGCAGLAVHRAPLEAALGVPGDRPDAGGVGDGAGRRPDGRRLRRDVRGPPAERAAGPQAARNAVGRGRTVPAAADRPRRRC